MTGNGAYRLYALFPSAPLYPSCHISRHICPFSVCSRGRRHEQAGTEADCGVDRPAECPLVAQKAAVDALRLGFHEVAHRLYLPLGGKHLAVVRHPLFGFHLLCHAFDPPRKHNPDYVVNSAAKKTCHRSDRPKRVWKSKPSLIASKSASERLSCCAQN